MRCAQVASSIAIWMREWNRSQKSGTAPMIVGCRS
jgi:hypothetical protein